MHVGSKFSRDEVDTALREHGFTPGTREWREAFHRSYIPLEDDTYMESDTFDLNLENYVSAGKVT